MSKRMLGLTTNESSTLALAAMFFAFVALISIAIVVLVNMSKLSF